MCAGLMPIAHRPLRFRSSRPEGWGCRNALSVNADERLNHTFEVTPGVLADECSALLRKIFREQMIEETACNERGCPDRGRLAASDWHWGDGRRCARRDACCGRLGCQALAAEASAENVSRETLAPEQGECMSRQRASLEVPVDMISIARTAQIESAQGLSLWRRRR